MTPIILGSAQFGMHYGVSNDKGVVTPAEVRAILDLARKNSFASIDTAGSYGVAEQVLGDVGVTDFKITTKIPKISKSKGTKSVIDTMLCSVKNSCERLNVKSCSGVLVHDCGDLLGKYGNEVVKGLKLLRELGWCDRVGVSVYHPEQLLRSMKKLDLDVVQFPLSVVDRRFLAGGLLERLREKGVELQARSIFLQGLLLSKSSQKSSYFSRWESLWKCWELVQLEAGVTPAEICINYISGLGLVDGMVVGVDSPSQYRQLLDCREVDMRQVDLSGVNCLDLALVDPTRW